MEEKSNEISAGYKRFRILTIAESVVSLRMKLEGPIPKLWF